MQQIVSNFVNNKVIKPYYVIPLKYPLSQPIIKIGAVVAFFGYASDKEILYRMAFSGSSRFGTICWLSSYEGCIKIRAN